MSVSRTPPKSSSNLVSPPHFGSDSAIYSHESQNTDLNVTKRTKRRFNDSSITDDLTLSDLMKKIDEIKKQQDTKFASIESSMIALTSLNSEMKNTIIHLSEKYDDVLSDLKILQQENNYFKGHIQDLEKKLDQYERNARSSAVEFRNIPISESENIGNFVEVTKKIGAVINSPIQDSDIRDVSRIKLKDKQAGPIIVNFTSTIKRENFLKAARSYNKMNREKRLSTASLNLDGPAKPVYVAESLTASARRLYYVARMFAKNHHYQYCWTSFGKVYVKRNANDPRVRVSCENDIENLKKII